MKAVAGIVAAVIGAALGLVGWVILMNVFAFVCRGLGNFLLCGGMGGPNLLDLLTLPLLVIGGGYLGWNMATERFE